MSVIMDKLSNIIPDFREIVEIFNGMLAQHTEDTAHIEDETKTSLVVLLCVLYKYQKRTKTMELEDSSVRLERSVTDLTYCVCRRYWQQTLTTGHCIRRGVASATRDSLLALCQENKVALAAELAIDTEDVIMTWVSEQQILETEPDGGGEDETPSISGHTSDFTITLDRENSLVVVTILGTRIFPRPNIYDVIMDLRAETRPFLDGEAHAGMVIGSKNILERSWQSLRDAVISNPGFSVLVVGYSLGAGLAQLFTAELLETEELRSELPPDTKIRALCYGAPPVFRAEDGGQHKVFPEIVVLQNNKDGIIAASIKTVNDLFNKTVAIDAAEISNDLMMKMIMELEKPTDGDGEDKEERPENIWSWRDLKTTVARSLNHYREDYGKVEQADWDTVREALENRKVDKRLTLNILGQTVLQMRRVEGEVEMRKFDGIEATRKLTGEITLSKQMFNHHMPWGYNALFSQDTDGPCDLEVFNLIV